MARESNKFKIGLFLVASLIILIGVIFWLGITRYFEDRINLVTYFDESVQGLDKGSPVRYRGVTIGSVESINVAPDGKLIEVVLSINPDIQIDFKKIRSQLVMAGITGLKFINLDFIKGEKTKLNFEPRYPVIDSSASSMKTLFESFNKVYDKIMELDIKGITERLKNSLEGINSVLDQTKMQSILKNIEKTTKGTSLLLNENKMKNIIKNVEDITENLKKATGNLEKVVDTKEIEEILSYSKKTVKNVEEITAFTEQELKKLEISKTKQKIKKILDEIYILTSNYSKVGKEMEKTIKYSRVNINTIVYHIQKLSRGVQKTLLSLEQLINTIEKDPSSLLRGKQLPVK